VLQLLFTISQAKGIISGIRDLTWYPDHPEAALLLLILNILILMVTRFIRFILNQGIVIGETVHKLESRLEVNLRECIW
jgi:hypothetical protein